MENHKRKKRSIFSRIGIFVMALAMIVTPVKGVAAGNTFEIDGGALPGDQKVVAKTSWKLAPGVTETELITNTPAGNHQNMEYISETDTKNSNVKIVAGYKDYSNSGKWGLQSTSKQAAAYNKAHPGEKVVAAVNGDYFNMTTGEPLGALVMNGKKIRDSYGRSYFAILKDGTPVIRTGNIGSDVQEAVGGNTVLIRDGKNVNNSGDQRIYTRNAIGIKADGTVVTFTTHGMNPPTSHGRTMGELTQMMLALGCVDAIQLDDGGSSTFCTQREGSDEFAMRNFSSDGTQRNVASTVLIVSTAKPDGEFDHFSISPNNTVYTQNSEVKFEALAVDSSGKKIDDSKIPAGIKWKLAADSVDYGTIDANGKFTSNGKEGEVTINMVTADGKVVGTTSITICAPDEVTFKSDEVSLGFSESTDLGLVAKYKDREVITKAGDFKWKITPDDEFKDFVGKEDQIGTFDGNIFTSSSSATVNANITATYAHKDNGASGTVHTIIGRLPSVMMDFEDQKNADGTTIPAKDYWSIDKCIFAANGGIEALTDDWKNARKDGSGNLVLSTDKTLLLGQYCNGINNGVINGRGGNASAEIIDIGSGEPVRFGNNALKINYDFSKVTGIEGACVGFSAQTQAIEGNPTGIGMWVYAPEGTPNLWLRLRLKDGAGNIVPLDFTQRMNDAYNGSNGKDYGGINWTGWKYVEADLTGKVGPFKLIGGETIRLMHTNGAYGIEAGKGMGDYLPDGTLINRADCKGSIYVDNLRFVYGANVDDTLTPVIDSITANGKELENGSTISENKVSFTSNFHDIQDKDMTGIDWDTIYIFIDGKDVTTGNTDNYHELESDNEIRLDDIVLSNGNHKIKVLLRDKFGNEATEERMFTVAGQEDMTTISLQPEENAPILNNTFKLQLKSNKIEDVAKVTANVELKKDYLDGVDVAFSDDYEGTWSVEKGTLKISAERKTGLAGLFATSDGDAAIATITSKIPSNLEQGSKFTYAIPNGTLELKDAYGGDGYPSGTFSLEEKAIDIEADLNIVIDELEVGDSDKKLYVYDRESKPVSDAEIYNKETGEVFGTTGAEGYLDITKLCENPAKYSFYAKKDNMYSFATEGQSFAIGGGEDAKPICIIANATNDNGTAKVFTWLSNPKMSEETAVVQVASKADYDANGDKAFKSYTGESEKYKFTKSSIAADNKSVRINKAKASGLKANTRYVYRVGDGNTWSETAEFKLPRTKGDVNMFIVGDTQAADTAVLDNIVNSLNADGKEYALGIQTGDLIENAGLYNDWVGGLNLFGKIKDIDMLHVVGNHELFGDSYGEVAEKAFAMPNKKYYSVEYGNVYVATISYTESRAQYDEAFAWLAEDAAKSDCQWKIVAMHQPAYYTNPAGGNGYVNEKLPAAAEKGGIDFVFAGHDHSYARTEPLLGGEVSEGGVVYFISGSTGEKSYTAIDNKDFHFAQINQDYGAMYLTLSATDKKLVVEAHESDGSVIDTYTKENVDTCASDGHKYVYDEDGLSCSICHYNRSADNYTGWAKDRKTYKDMYFIDGTFQTGWTQQGDDVFYFSKDGLKQDVSLKDDVATTCSTRGYKLYECKTASAGEKEYKVRYVKPAGHEYDANRVCAKCGWKEATLDECTVTLTQKKYDYTGNPVKPYVRVECRGKKLESYYEYKVVGYDKNIELGKVSAQIVPVTKYTGDAVNHKGTLAPGGSVKVYYEIAPAKPQNLAASTKATSINLSWDKSLGADGYRVYKYEGSRGAVLYKTIDNVETTSCNVSGLDPETSYKFRVASYADTENGVVESNGNYVTAQTKSRLIAGVENTTVKAYSKLDVNGISVSWEKVGSYKMDYYELYRSTSETFGTTPYYKTKYGTTTKFGNTGNLEADKTYYYKVRGVRVIDGKKYYSKWSNVTNTKFSAHNISLIKGVNNTSIDASSKLGPNSIVVSWKKAGGYNMDYYEVYKSTSKTFGTKPFYVTKKGTTTSVKNSSSLTDGKRYYYRVRGVRVIDGTKYYSKWSDITSERYDKADAKLIYGVTNTNIDASSKLGPKSIIISWKKASNYKMDYYEVYKSTSNTFGTTPLYTTKYGTSTSMKNTSSLTDGNTYYYKVRGVRTINGAKYYSKWSDITETRYDKDKAALIYGVANTSIDASSKMESDGIKVSWVKAGNYKVDYYEVYKSTSKTFGTKPFYVTKKGTTTSVTNRSGLVKGKTYYYKVRGVRVFDDQKYYTKWSDITYRTVR